MISAVLQEKKNKFDSLSPEEQDEIFNSERERYNKSRSPPTTNNGSADDNKHSDDAISSNNLDIAKAHWPNLPEAEVLAAIKHRKPTCTLPPIIADVVEVITLQC